MTTPGMASQMHTLLKHVGVEPFTKEEEWTAIDSFMEGFVSCKKAKKLGVTGMALNVFNKDGRLAHRYDSGDVSNQRLHVASVSKLVSALVLMACVSDGDIKLEDTTGEILGWDGEKGTITLDNLGSMTSGLIVDDDSMYRSDLTLAQSVDIIAEYELMTPPGSQFYYKSTDWQVAARMVEVATGKSWNQLFEEKIKKRVGLRDPGLQFTQLDSSSKNPTHLFLYGRMVDFNEDTDNPLCAAGLQATVSELSEILFLILNHGDNRGGETVIKSQYIERMFTNKYTNCKMFRDDVTGGFTILGYRYGFGCWLERDISKMVKMHFGNDFYKINSLGVYGTTPWIDMEHEYFAIMSMEGSDPSTCYLSYEMTYRLQRTIARTIGRHHND